MLGSSTTPPWVFNLHPWCFPPFGVDEGEDLQIGGVGEGEAQLEHGAFFKNFGKGLASSLWFPPLPFLFNL